MSSRSAPSTGDDALVLRFASPTDLAAIGASLQTLGGPHFKERFPDRAPKDFYHWKYLENPLGEAVVGVAMSGDRPVSTVAAVPKRIQIGAETLTAYELGDFFTDEAYRRRGLFSRLVEIVCGELARRGASFAYVRPNESSFPILANHLRFFEPMQLQERRYVVVGRVLTERYGLPRALASLTAVDRFIQLALAAPPPPRGFVIERVQRFDRSVDELWERVHGQYHFALVRGSTYLNWRFVDSPTPYRSWLLRRDGIACGFVVAFFSPAEAAGYIMDLFTEPGDSAGARCLIRSCFENFLDQGVSRVYAWVLAGHSGLAADIALRRACMFRMGPPLHFAVRFLNSSSTIRMSPERSHVSLGDFDGA